LICEREKEIKEFTPEPYFRVTGEFKTTDGDKVKAELNKRLSSVDEARSLLNDCISNNFTISDISVKPTKKTPAAPFTTSTLQQEAGRKLGFTVGQTMSIAQRLYESGLITYMRTDSLNLSQLALNTIKKEITAEMGERYVKTRQYHTSSKGAQEAHEAIRPTYIDRRSIDGTVQEKRLYDLIWKRTVASQMADAEIEKTTVDIRPGKNSGAYFQASGEVIKFDGFLKVYLEGNDDDERGSQTGETLLPAMKTGETLTAETIHATERFTQQPPRFTEASLVKKMEELGIGRPSTYAPTISTIQNREYVEKGSREGQPREYRVIELHNGKIKEITRTENWGTDKGKLIPTDTGIIVNDFLTALFPNVLDYNFTAHVEERFDEIAEGKRKWNDELHDFYKDFHPLVDAALTTRTEHKVGERLLGTDPATGKNVFVKIGRFGPLVQIGDSDAEEKPRFASLLKGQSMSAITLDEALRLFDFPRNLGDFEDKAVTVAIGRFGPYVRHDGKFVSIPKELEPAAITLEEATDLIRAKRQADAMRHIKSFDEDPEIEILNGRYGPYIAKNKSNYKIPKSVTDPATLTYEEVKEIIEKQDAAPKRTTRKTAPKTSAKTAAKGKTKKEK
ncbi:MAG: DNA topoisomerase I, partial [Muribaculaceae bacterium]|nr:DNA topoisomerase I [Muribaculaceae bacterium]